MPLHFKLRLVAVADDDQQESVEEVIELNKDHERLEHLGLTLDEAKALLREVQRLVRQAGVGESSAPPLAHASTPGRHP